MKRLIWLGFVALIALGTVSCTALAHSGKPCQAQKVGNHR